MAEKTSTCPSASFLLFSLFLRLRRKLLIVDDKPLMPAFADFPFLIKRSHVEDEAASVDLQKLAFAKTFMPRGVGASWVI